MLNPTSFFVFFFCCKEEKHETHKDAFWPVEENVVVVVVVVVVLIISSKNKFAFLSRSLSVSDILFCVQFVPETRKETLLAQKTNDLDAFARMMDRRACVCAVCAR